MTTTLDTQRRLTELGHAVGLRYSIRCRLSLIAVRQFQWARNLVAVDTVGPVTLAACRTAARATAPIRGQ